MPIFAYAIKHTEMWVPAGSRPQSLALCFGHTTTSSSLIGMNTCVALDLALTEDKFR